MGLFDWIAGSNPSEIAASASEATIGGIFKGVKDLIEEFHLAPEQAAQVKIKIAELELATLQAQMSDTANARQMQMTNKSHWPGLLSFITLCGFYGLGWWIMSHGLPPSSEAGRDILIQWFNTLMNGVLLVYGFWLGTSHGSQNKDLLLYQAQPKDKAP